MVRYVQALRRNMNRRRFQPPALPQPVQPDDVDQYFEVETIMQRGHYNGVIFYLIKWVGYPESSNTWEPEDYLDSIRNLIDDFNRIHPESETAELELVYQIR